MAAAEATQDRTLIGRLHTGEGVEHIDTLNAQFEASRWEDLERALEICQEACTLAQAQGDVNRFAYSSLNLAHVMIRLSRYDEALTLLTSLHERFQNMGDRMGEQRVLSRLGDAYSEVGQLKEALTCYLQSLHLAEETRDPQGEMICLNNLGVFYEELGDYTRAAEHYVQSMRLAKQRNDERQISLALINLGEVRRKLNHPEDARHAHSEALVLSIETSNAFLEGAAATGLGSDLYVLERFEEALTYFEQAHVALQLCGERRYELDTLWGLGLTHSKLKHPEAAHRYQHEALELARAIGYPLGEATSLGHLGQICLKENRPAEAIVLLEQGLAMAERFGFTTLVFETHHRLSKAWEQRGDFARALAHYQKFHEVREQVSAEQLHGQTQALFVQLELEKAQHQADVHRLKNIELAQANVQLEAKAEENSRLVNKLKRQAQEDALTGLPNRRSFATTLARTFRRSARKTTPMVVALADIDNFKVINDSFSHAVGDAVLKKVSHLLTRVIRRGDTVARIGGEEFAFVFPATHAEEALAVCERLRSEVARYNWHRIQPDLQVTLSIGLSYDTGVKRAEKLLAQADAKLYEAKRTGKNRVA